ncbi:Bax inhibitor-1/YccA family protein [Vagococcus teuberi]
MSMDQQHQTIENTTGLAKFYSKVYGYLGVGLGISALISYLVLNVFAESVLPVIFGNPLLFWGMWIAQLVLVVYLGKNAFNDSAKSLIGFIAYSALTGVTISVTLAMYNQQAIVRAFVTTAIMFVGMSLLGVFIKKDLSAIGHALYSLVIGVIIATLINTFFLKSAPVDYFISYSMVVIFSGLIAYDNQKIKLIYQENGAKTASGLAVYCALSLYLDIVNLFLALVRIFGRD